MLGSIQASAQAMMTTPLLSLKLTEKDLIKCHVGCSIKEVCSGLEIEESELFRESGADRKTLTLLRKEKSHPYKCRWESSVLFKQA